MSFHQDNEYLSASLSGPVEKLESILEQLAWLGAACTDSKFEDRPCYRTPIVQLEQEQGCSSIMTITYMVENFTYPEQEGAVKQGWQWFIGKNPSFAAGFEVEPRENGELGLELPIDIMLALSRANYLIDFDGTSVL